MAARQRQASVQKQTHLDISSMHAFKLSRTINCEDNFKDIRCKLLPLWITSCDDRENAVDIPIQSEKDIAYYRNTEIQKYRSTYVVDFPLRSGSLEWTLRIDYSGVDSLVHPHIYF